MPSPCFLFSQVMVMEKGDAPRKSHFSDWMDFTVLIMSFHFSLQPP
jgi:hypothetical protein